LRSRARRAHAFPDPTQILSPLAACAAHQSASHVTEADPATNSSALVAGEETSILVVVVVLVRIWRQRLRWAARGASKALLWQRKRETGCSNDDGLVTCDQPAGVDAGPSPNTTVGLQQKGSSSLWFPIFSTWAWHPASLPLPLCLYAVRVRSCLLLLNEDHSDPERGTLPRSASQERESVSFQQRKIFSQKVFHVPRSSFHDPIVLRTL
jgi:hypothetical protein